MYAPRDEFIIWVPCRASGVCSALHRHTVSSVSAVQEDDGLFQGAITLIRVPSCTETIKPHCAQIDLSPLSRWWAGYCPAEAPGDEPSYPERWVSWLLGNKHIAVSGFVVGCWIPLKNYNLDPFFSRAQSCKHPSSDRWCGWWRREKLLLLTLSWAGRGETPAYRGTEGWQGCCVSGEEI